jgi:hypothetical protein
MTTEHFHVVFSGKILEYADLNMVKRNVARVFKQPVEKIEPLFSGKPVALKKNVDAATAEKYRLAMERAGALCDIIPASATPVVQPTADTGNAATATQAGMAAEPSGMSLADVGVTLIEPKPVPAANIDTADMDMDEVGVTLVEPRPVPEANIDTSGMDMDEVGVTLIEPQPVPEPDIDTSQLKLAD